MSLFAVGLGYSVRRLIERGVLGPASGTVRTTADAEAWRACGVATYPFDATPAQSGLAEALRRSDVAVISVPPREDGDPALRALAAPIRAAGLRRIVYLSTVGVYGDVGGAWVDETSPTSAARPRTRARLAAEDGWRELGAQSGVPVDILRLAGIYGPGRSAFDRLRDGTARRIVKPGQVFNRIHVDDIAAAIETVVAAGRAGEVYNVADGAPSPPEDVVAYAAEWLGVPAPPEEEFETAGLSGMSLSFYEENRRVRVEKLRALGWRPLYPTYREGLKAILAGLPPRSPDRGKTRRRPLLSLCWRRATTESCRRPFASPRPSMDRADALFCDDLRRRTRSRPFKRDGGEGPSRPVHAGAETLWLARGALRHHAGPHPFFLRAGRRMQPCIAFGVCRRRQDVVGALHTVSDRAAGAPLTAAVLRSTAPVQ